MPGPLDRLKSDPFLPGDLLCLAGAVAFTWGVSLVYFPAGLMVGGGILFAAGFWWHR